MVVRGGRGALLLTWAVPQHLVHGTHASPPPGLLAAGALRDAACALRLPQNAGTKPKLKPAQVKCRRVTGSIRWILKVRPSFSVVAHKLSRVTNCPPPDAVPVCETVACVGVG